MKRVIFFLLIGFMHTVAISQPYLDIANISYAISPNGSIAGNGAKTYSLVNSIAAVNIPVELKKRGGVFLASPFFEQWQTFFPQNPSTEARYSSIGLPLTFIHTFSQQWRILCSITPRVNYESLAGKNIWQVGGAILVTRQVSPKLALKAGLFYNREFFGNFFVPLAGIEWKVNQRNKLFGVLPNSLTYEHKASIRFYYGAMFHAITNSYRIPNDGYVRIDDNRLGFFADAYVAKNIVLSVETGYSVLRRMVLTQKALPTLNIGLKDNYYCKLTLAFRVRLDGSVKQ
jgi:Domain of unknown function (DUF6268)